MILHLLAQRAFPYWNKRPITERDIRRYCKRKGIVIVEGKVGSLGLYTPYGGYPFIVVDPSLQGPLRLWVLLHELAHHLLHVPGLHLFDRNFESKADYQANFIAAVAMIPLSWVQTKSFADLLEEGYPEDLLWFRKGSYEQFKI
ncbi:MAG: IrrE N-terminal-like domain [Blastocatellia bacterium]|jgi:Zn-dependent peptidase ImmA (M78 family)|nr:IrrE N-terminal-like domain [Blastocatellia bacterium]